MVASPSILFTRLLAKARLKHLQLLLRIAELESLRKAADDVGLSQPGATHALAELETLLGAPLFERHARGMRPTPIGRAMLPMVRGALAHLQGCAETVVAMQAGVAGIVRVATIVAGQSGLMAGAVPSFSLSYPDAVIEIQVVGAENMFALLEQDRVDLLVCREPQQLRSDYRFIPVMSDRYAVVAGPAHPLTKRAKVTIADLAEQTWLLPPPTGIAARDFDVLCDKFGFVPKACWVNTRSMLLMLAMLQQREVLAFVPRNAALQLLDLQLITEVKGPPNVALEMAPLGLVVKRDEVNMADVIRRFIDHVALLGDQESPLPGA